MNILTCCPLRLHHLSLRNVGLRNIDLRRHFRRVSSLLTYNRPNSTPIIIQLLHQSTSHPISLSLYLSLMHSLHQQINPVDELVTQLIHSTHKPIRSHPQIHTNTHTPHHKTSKTHHTGTHQQNNLNLYSSH